MKEISLRTLSKYSSQRSKNMIHLKHERGEDVKRLVCIVLTVLLFGGCTLSQPTDSTHPQSTTPTDTTAAYDGAWAYEQLSATQQKNYAAVYTAVVDGFKTDSTVTLSADGTEQRGIAITLPHPLVDEGALSQLYNAFMQDNPSFFHIGGVYGYGGRQHGDERQFTSIKLTYTMSAAERIAAKTVLEQKVQTILDVIEDTDTSYDTELKLHDALCAAVTYHDVAANSPKPMDTYPSAFTAYGALVEGKAVCEGYARAMQYLLQCADIPATVVSGKDMQGNAHMWNAVRLDKELYHLDATWDDSNAVVTYSYFNLNTEELAMSHHIDNTSLGLETSTATAQNYYQKNGTYLDTLQLEDIADVVAETLASGEETVHLRFSKTAFDNALLFVRSSSWFIETVNAYLPEAAEPFTALTVLCDEKQRTVTICKKTS